MFFLRIGIFCNQKYIDAYIIGILKAIESLYIDFP